MKYDVEFWKKVLSEYEGNNSCWAICNLSDSFKYNWNGSDVFKNNLREIAENWPDKPKGSRVGTVFLFYNGGLNEAEKRKTRLDFLNYLIKNKIEFEV